MKLNAGDKEIISLVDLDADIAISELCAKLKERESTVRYRLLKLERANVLRRCPLLDLSKCGFLFVGIYFSPAADNKFSVASLRRVLSSIKAVTWAGEFSGDFFFGLSLTVSSVSDIETSIDKLTTAMPGLFQHKAMAIKLRSHKFSHRYLSSKENTIKNALMLGGTPTKSSLDDTDKKILAGLARAEHRSNRELAQKLQIPLSTLNGRLEKLQELGILVKYIYEVNAEVLGVQCYTLLLFCKGISEKIRAKVLTLCETTPHITALYCTLGSWDFEINVEAHQQQTLQEVVESLYATLGTEIAAIKVLTRTPTLRYSQVPF